MTDRLPKRRWTRFAALAPAAAVLAVIACDAVISTAPDGEPPAVVQGDGTASPVLVVDELFLHQTPDAADRRLLDGAGNALVLELDERITIRPLRDADHRSQYVIGSDVPLILRATAERPLIYVDGVRVDADDERVRRIHPEDITTVEVIRGEAAVRAEGPDAAGGVIRVTTRALIRD